MAPAHPFRETLLYLACGAIGGLVGYAAFFWLWRQGLYAIVLPGALLGLGCGLFAQRSSWTMGLVAGLAGLLLGLFTEWRFMGGEMGFWEFLGSAGQLQRSTQVLIILGGLFAAWFGRGRNDPVFRRRPLESRPKELPDEEQE